ncbi:hypothetical protein Sgleb_12790 [Streptomyces glebosus]|uniref:Uncharacterized protein n=1 Tax=Streptomyces glebosus TaxID=249580 RepID=A0A640SQX7_9ACTN|nr:hypothetical protein Sgleb_12790 [Streptomyces glebosus]GHG66859.1 hypothetical protein GCM10010513_36530 [Streptomyces glebosus]
MEAHITGARECGISTVTACKGLHRVHETTDPAFQLTKESQPDTCQQCPHTSAFRLGADYQETFLLAGQNPGSVSLDSHAGTLSSSQLTSRL